MKDIKIISGRAALAALLLMIIGTASAADGLRAYVDRSTVYTGETVTLTLELSGDGAGQPDLRPLAQDFSVMSTSQGSEIRIINGQRSDTTRWQIVLQPLSTGELPIPSLSIGGRHSQPLTLKVRELPPDVAKRQAESLFIEMELGDVGTGVYVQQQIPLTVRLYTDLPIRDGTLSDPTPENAVVERLGKDRNYAGERNGHRYRVIERHYALFPERSGRLTIPPVEFRGSVPVDNRNRRSSGTLADRVFNDPVFDRAFSGGSPFSSFFSGDPMAMFSARRPVSTRSEAIEVEVGARPEDFGGGNWLPAQNLQLTDSWVDQPPEWQVGKPVERTITLTAVGLAASQVPQIPLTAPSGVRIYPGKPENESRTDGERVFAISRQTTTYIPSQSGSLELPPVEVEWWDTATRTRQTTKLPRWQVEVAPGVATDPESGAGPVAGDAGVADNVVVPDLPAAGDTTGPTRLLDQLKSVLPTQAPAAIPWLAGLVGLLLVVYLLARRRRSVPPAANTAGEELDGGDRVMPSETEARRAFEQACRDSNPGAVARTLLEWAAVHWPQQPPTSLAALAQRLAVGGDEIKALEQALYAPGEHPWSADPLLGALRGGLCEQTATAETVDSGLAPLYPRQQLS